jgi:hypothetical protein
MANGEQARIRSSLHWLSATGYRLLTNAIRLSQRDLSSLICHLWPCHTLDTLLCCLLTEHRLQFLF